MNKVEKLECENKSRKKMNFNGSINKNTDYNLLLNYKRKSSYYSFGY